MSEAFDIYTIIFLVLAVFIILRLRSVLGTRTGHERPPHDPFAPRDNAPAAGGANENVVTLPKRRGADVVPAPASDEPAVDRWKGLIAKNSNAEAGLAEIAAADRNFDGATFIEGAKAAYEMIVTAFAQGNRKELKPLLAPDVLESFSAVIADRESRGETAETTFVSIDKADITEAELKDRQASVTVRFVSQLVSSTRDKAGQLVDGSSEAVVEVVDVWTFAHDVSSSDPNWKLIATESAE
jgi:predicted lipid-binding transport protein (Tim44 family)